MQYASVSSSSSSSAAAAMTSKRRLRLVSSLSTAAEVVSRSRACESIPSRASLLVHSDLVQYIRVFDVFVQCSRRCVPQSTMASGIRQMPSRLGPDHESIYDRADRTSLPVTPRASRSLAATKVNADLPGSSYLFFSASRSYEVQLHWRCTRPVQAKICRRLKVRSEYDCDWV